MNELQYSSDHINLINKLSIILEEKLGDNNYVQEHSKYHIDNFLTNIVWNSSTFTAVVVVYFTLMSVKYMSNKRKIILCTHDL